MHHLMIWWSSRFQRSHPIHTGHEPSRLLVCSPIVSPSSRTTSAHHSRTRASQAAASQDDSVSVIPSASRQPAKSTQHEQISRCAVYYKSTT